MHKHYQIFLLFFEAICSIYEDSCAFFGNKLPYRSCVVCILQIELELKRRVVHPGIQDRWGQPLWNNRSFDVLCLHNFVNYWNWRPPSREQPRAYLLCSDPHSCHCFDNLRHNSPLQTPESRRQSSSQPAEVQKLPYWAELGRRTSS